MLSALMQVWTVQTDHHGLEKLLAGGDLFCWKTASHRGLQSDCQRIHLVMTNWTHYIIAVSPDTGLHHQNKLTIG